jgi:hypothetical protein
VFERRQSNKPDKAWSPYSVSEANEDNKEDLSSMRKSVASKPRISVRPQSAIIASKELFNLLIFRKMKISDFERIVAHNEIRSDIAETSGFGDQLVLR